MLHEPKPFGDDNEEPTGNLVMKIIGLGGGEVRFGDNRFEGTVIHHGSE